MAQNQSEKYIQGAILQGGGIPNVQSNMPIQYADRQHQYMAWRTRAFADDRAKYSSDFVQAKVQGLDKNNWYRYLTTKIRFADIHSMPTITQPTDDTKNILFAEKKIDYFPIGAKVETMGSTWICTNPSNLSSVNTNAVVRRCNTSYNLYDYYGNILTEPIVLEKITMMGNDNDKPQNLVMMDGYFNVICQLNDNTRQLGLNQRIILGSKAYHITGFNDFYQEFSGNYDSTHILYYTVRIEEPNQNDDVPNHIANGKTYGFTAQIIGGEKELSVGETLDLSAAFIKRNGDNTTEVQPTEEYPSTWKWESDNNGVLTVNENGQVTAVSSGTAQITATLTQNTAVTATVELVVAEVVNEPYVAFNGVIPQSLEQYDTATLATTFYENGVATDKPIAWSFSGANKRSYTTTINGNSVEIYCVLADNIPLTVTAECEGKTAETKIQLLGY